MNNWGNEPLPEKKIPAGGTPNPLSDQPVGLKPPSPAGEEFLPSMSQSLELFWRAIIRYRYVILATSLAIGFSVYIYCKMQTPIYLAEAKILIEPPAPTEAEEIVNFNSSQTGVEEGDLFTQKDVIESRVVVERILQDLGLDKTAPFKNSTDPIGQLLGMISVRVSMKSDTLSVGTRNADPVLATTIANGAVDAYIQVSDEKERAWIEQTLDQMRHEITTIKKRLSADQQKVKQYEIEHPKVIAKETLERQVNRLSGELAEVSSEKLRLRTEIEELVSFKEQGADLRDHPLIAKDPSVEQMLVILQQKQVELSQMLNIYKERFPLVAEKRVELVQLEGIILKRKAQIVEDLKSKYILLAAREHELKNAIERKSGELSNLLEEFTGYEALIGEAEISKNLYSLILDRMNKAAIIGRSAQTKVKVLSQAIVPRSPIWPNTKNLVSLSFVGSLVVMSYLMLLFYLMLTPIESEEEIIQGVRRPVLAQIPYMQSPEREKEVGSVLDRKEGTGQDAFHVLRSNLLAGNHRTILFASARPSEGKTFLVHNLGVFLAREGWRVLLIGTDFRDSSLKNRMKVDPNGGSLEDYMSDGRYTEQQVIQTSSEPRLFYLGFKKATANSLGTITSPRFKKLLREVSNKFDFTLLDSPPVQLFPDVEMLSREVKDVIFVVRSGKTPLRTLSKAIKKIERGGAHVSGTVLNFKAFEWSNYYYYNYYYGEGRGRKFVFFLHMVNGAKRYAVGVRQFVEKRLHLRFKAALPAEFTHITSDGEKHNFSGTIINISEGGLLAEYREESNTPRTDPSEFGVLELKINLTETKPILAKGKVVRVDRTKGRVRLGIELSEISEENRSKIKQFFESQLPLDKVLTFIRGEK